MKINSIGRQQISIKGGADRDQDAEYSVG